MRRPTGQPATSTPHVKGVVLAEFLRWYTMRHGPARIVRAFDHLPPEKWRTLRMEAGLPAVQPFGWYPVSLLAIYIEQLEAGLSPEERAEFVRAAGRASFQGAGRAVFQSVFRMLVSPARYRRHADQVWRFFHDTGTLLITAPEPNVHVATRRNWAGHHPFICEATSWAATTIYEALGCQAVTREQLACVSRGDSECVYRFTWDRARGPLDTGDP